MQVTFKYSAQVRQAAGVEFDRLSLSEGADLLAALGALADRRGEDFRALVVDRDGAIRPSLLVVVNGQVVPRGERCSLADGDQVSIISAMGGG